MAVLRAAKARHRLERIAAGWRPEPRFVRWVPLQIGVRDKTSGEIAWTDFTSLRNALRRLSIVRRFYVPGP